MRRRISFRSPGLFRHWLLAVGLLSTGALPAWASLKWENTSVTAPAKFGDQSASASFKFTNDGAGPVTILEVSSSCGCTVGEVAKRTYAPGEQGEVTAHVNFGNLSGVQTKTLTVTTDEGLAPTLLTVTVNIPAGATVKPRLHVWSLGGQATEQTCDILAPEGATLESVRVLEAAPGFTSRLDEVEPGKHYRLVVTPDDTDQKRRGQLGIEFTAEGGHRQVVPIYLFVR